MKRLSLLLAALLCLPSCDLLDGLRQFHGGGKPVPFSTPWKKARAEKKEEAARIAEREHLQSFASDYAAWTTDWEEYMANLPEPPLPE